MSEFMSLAGKVALVTGASRGIGRAIAEELVKLGAKVIGTATTQQGAQHISAYLGENGTGLPLDVRDKASIDALFAAIKLKYSNLDILVNNAGITKDNLTIRMKDQEWQDVIDTNLGSVFHLSKSVLRGMMKARFGRIINVGSVIGSVGNAGQVNYATAKAGIIGLTKSLAREVASRGITVNTVAPGFIETDMTSQLSTEQQQAIAAQVPMDRLGKPAEIAAAVVFLASDHASYITGETLHINGGLHMS